MDVMDYMTEYEAIKDLYEQAKKVDPVSALKMAVYAHTEEESRFYAYIAYMHLKREQTKVSEIEQDRG